MKNRAFGSTDALEIPPAAAIACEDEVAGRAPLRLPDRLFAVSASNVRNSGQLAVRGEIADVELAPVPRHPGQVPREEAEPRAVGRDAWIRVEVPAGGDHPWLGRSRRWEAPRAR